MDYIGNNSNPLDVEQWRMQLRIQEEATKINFKNEGKMRLEYQRNLMKEEERERRKAQFDMLKIDQNGKIFVETQNLQIQKVQREVANFLHPEMMELCRIKNPNDKLFLLTFDLNREIQYAILNPEKCGSPTYLIKKIAASGGYIMANNQAKKKEFVLQLITFLISQTREKIYLPERREWYVDENQKLRFFLGRWTWEEASKCAK